VLLEGELRVPEGARGVVLFAHGSGSGRRSPRNRFVADALVRAGLATLLFDLLTAAEEAAEARTRHLRFARGAVRRSSPRRGSDPRSARSSPAAAAPTSPPTRSPTSSRRRS
jgi:predicted alpha/beta-hydrolase family hydrolase